MRKRDANFAERARKAEIRKIRRKHFDVIGSGRGKKTVRLVIDHQSFQVGEMNSYTVHEARFMTTSLAIALHRFKFGG